MATRSSIHVVQHQCDDSNPKEKVRGGSYYFVFCFLPLPLSLSSEALVGRRHVRRGRVSRLGVGGTGADVTLLGSRVTTDDTSGDAGILLESRASSDWVWSCLGSGSNL